MKSQRALRRVGWWSQCGAIGQTIPAGAGNDFLVPEKSCYFTMSYLDGGYAKLSTLSDCTAWWVWGLRNWCDIGDSRTRYKNSREWLSWKFSDLEFTDQNRIK